MLPAEAPAPAQFADDGTRLLAIISLAYPIYYMVVSWVISVRYWLKKARRSPALAPAEGSGPWGPENEFVLKIAESDVEPGLVAATMP